MSLEKNRGETDKNVGNQGQSNPRKRSMFEIMITDKQKSQVFGMNFLEKPKDKPDEIKGAYDPKKEVWIGHSKEVPNTNGTTYTSGKADDTRVDQ